MENVSEPDLRAGSVLVEGIAVGVCGTDVEITKGKYGQMCPGPSVCECSLRQNEQPSQQYHEQTCQMMIEFALFLVGKPLHREGTSRFDQMQDVALNRREIELGA